MRVPPINWTAEKLNLLHNTTYSVRELSEMLEIRPGSVRSMRNKLGIVSNIGAKLGKPNIKKMRQVDRTCIGKECNNIFTVNQASKKKYCCHSCQQHTANVAKKGFGSRTIRNPNTPEYKKYSRLVHGLSQKTYIQNIDIINPNRYPRTLCGVENGWQLDHIMTIKECFENGIDPMVAASVSNLRMLPWKDNLMRQYGNQD